MGDRSFRGGSLVTFASSLALAACGSIDSGPTAVDARAAPTAGPELHADAADGPPPATAPDARGAGPAFDRRTPERAVEAAAPRAAGALRFEWLVAERPEEPKFALHTYVLLGSPPTLTTEERYRRMFEGLLAPGEPGGPEGAARREPGARNVTHVPVLGRPTGPVDADWMLENYDYATARNLLVRLRGSYPDGPYIVSTAHPLSDPDVPLGQRLEQDLSACPVRLIDGWIPVYLAQDAQVEFWRADRLRRLQLGLREGLTRSAEQDARVDLAVSDLDDWIVIFD